MRPRNYQYHVSVSPSDCFYSGHELCRKEKGSVNRCRSRTPAVQSDTEPLRYQLKNNEFYTCITQRREMFSRLYYASWRHGHDFRTNHVAVGTLKLGLSLNEERLGSTSSPHPLLRLFFVGGLDWPSKMYRSTFAILLVLKLRRW
jgi:hypothetical protein